MFKNTHFLIDEDNITSQRATKIISWIPRGLILNIKQVQPLKENKSIYVPLLLRIVNIVKRNIAGNFSKTVSNTPYRGMNKNHTEVGPKLKMSWLLSLHHYNNWKFEFFFDNVPFVPRLALTFSTSLFGTNLWTVFNHVLLLNQPATCMLGCYLVLIRDNFDS